MSKKFSYTAPKLNRFEDYLTEGFCNIGSLASSSSGSKCEAGFSANSYCAGGGSQGTACSTGSSPGNDLCTSGISATGWSLCNTGFTIIMANCGVGNSPA